jgi:hypothetical protein
MNAFFSGSRRGSSNAVNATAAAAAPQHPHGRTLLAELALGFTPYLLVFAAVLLVGR